MPKKEREPEQIAYTDVADFFLALANESGGIITNLKLQKLVYYSQAWHLANFKKPLFSEDFQAWVHGPVIPALYEEYKHFGASPLTKEVDLETVSAKLPEEVVDFLSEVAKVYMQYDGYALEMMTHQEDPWIQAREGFEPDARCSNIIPQMAMQKFYGEKIKD